MHKIIEACISMLDFKLKNDISITREYFANDPIILGNVSKLHQAILNILTNSVDANNKEGKINIHTNSSESQFEITIRDNGLGISKENLHKISDPFFTTKPQGVGTGLGLSITKSIIEEHRGTIDFQSEINQGTTVTITLPKNKYEN
jgi:signal transduction histidine kinase